MQSAHCMCSRTSAHKTGLRAHVVLFNSAISGMLAMPHSMHLQCVHCWLLLIWLVIQHCQLYHNHWKTLQQLLLQSTPLRLFCNMQSAGSEVDARSSADSEVCAGGPFKQDRIFWGRVPDKTSSCPNNSCHRECVDYAVGGEQVCLSLLQTSTSSALVSILSSNVLLSVAILRCCTPVSQNCMHASQSLCDA